MKCLGAEQNTIAKGPCIIGSAIVLLLFAFLCITLVCMYKYVYVRLDAHYAPLFEHKGNTQNKD